MPSVWFWPRAQRRGRHPLVLIAATIATWLIWMPGELILILWLEAGLLAAWLYMTVFVLLLAGIFGWRFCRGGWKHITMIPAQPRLT